MAFGGSQPGTYEIPLSGTGTEVAKPGRPFITDDSLTHMKTGDPHFGFELHHGMDAPEINSFTLNFLRGGLTIGSNEPQALTERWNGHKWSCTHKPKRELHCDTATPLDTAHVILAFPLLHESSGLKKKIDKGTATGTYKVQLRVDGKVVGTVTVPIE